MELSIVVPVYNAEKYLRQCLDSLVALKIENYEIILVNDGSTDGSQAIADDYTVRYPELVKCFAQKNSGVSCARNFGMSQATGTYIAFVDSDDYILPEKFEALWHKVQNSGVDVAVANLQRDFDGKIVPDDLPRGKRRKLEKMGTVAGQTHMAAAYNYVKDEVKGEPVAKVYKRTFLKEHHLRFFEGIRFEDTLFVIQVLLCAQKVQYFNLDFYRYRMHQASFMHQKIGTLQIESLWAVAVQMYEQLEQVNAARCAYDSTIVSLLYRVYRYGGVKDVAKAKEMVKRTGFVSPKAIIKKIIMLRQFS